MFMHRRQRTSAVSTSSSPSLVDVTVMHSHHRKQVTARTSQVLLSRLVAVLLIVMLLLLSGACTVSAQQQQQQFELVVTLPLNSSVGISHAAAVMMALQHAQDQNPRIVSQFATCYVGSSSNVISNTSSVGSNNLSPTLAGWNVTFVDSSESTSSIIQLMMDGRSIDAVIGGHPTAANFQSDEPALAQLASQLHWPLLLYGGGNERNLMSNTVFADGSSITTTRSASEAAATSFATRIFPSATAYGDAIIDYLILLLRRTDYFALVVEQTSSSALQYLQAVLANLNQQHVQSQVFSYQLDQPELAPSQQQQQHQQSQSSGGEASENGISGSAVASSNLNAVLQEIKETGYRTILFLLDDELYPQQLANMAQLTSSAIHGDESQPPIWDNNYVWVLVGNVDLQYFPNAPQDVLDFVQGSIVISPVEKFMWVDNESLPMAWDDPQTNQVVPDLQQKLPSNANIPNNYYSTHEATAGSGFMYDAVAALLLASTCRDPTTTNGTIDMSHDSVAKRIQLSNFVGASGLVVFDASQEVHPMYPGCRVDYTVPFGAYNVLSNGSLTLVGVRSGQTTSNATVVWKSTNTTVVYSSGSTIPPPLRDNTDQNYLTAAALAWGFVLFGLLTAFLLFCAWWLYRYRAIHSVRAAQPIFLGLLLLGSMAVASCIITNSFDESMGWSQAQLSSACTATPWLIICGVQLIYSSLFCKLYRIDMVLQFRRRKVTVAQVLGPMAAIFGTVLILLTAWTVTDGFEWVRTVENTYTGESSAKCQGSHVAAWFTPICLLMAIAVVLTAVVVWKTRDIDSVYSETTMISAMIIFQIQLVLVTVPLMILVESTDTVTRYLVHVTIYFLLGASSSGFLILPRMYRFYFPKNVAPKRGSLEGIRVSGLPIADGIATSSNGLSNRISSTAGDSQSHFIAPGRKSPSWHSDEQNQQQLSSELSGSNAMQNSNVPGNVAISRTNGIADKDSFDEVSSDI